MVLTGDPARVSHENTKFPPCAKTNSPSAEKRTPGNSKDCWSATLEGTGTVCAWAEAGINANTAAIKRFAIIWRPVYVVLLGKTSGIGENAEHTASMGGGFKEMDTGPETWTMPPSIQGTQIAREPGAAGRGALNVHVEEDEGVKDGGQHHRVQQRPLVEFPAVLLVLRLLGLVALVAGFVVHGFVPWS